MELRWVRAQIRRSSRAGDQVSACRVTAACCFGIALAYCRSRPLHVAQDWGTKYTALCRPHLDVRRHKTLDAVRSRCNRRDAQHDLRSG